MSNNIFLNKLASPELMAKEAAPPTSNIFLKKLENLPQPESKPGILESTGRIAARSGLGIAAEGAGLAGNILSLPYEGIGAGMRALGMESTPYEESYLGKILPRSSTLQKGIEKDVPFIKPKNDAEKFISDLVTDTASIWMPGKAAKALNMPKSTQFALSPFKSLAISTGSNALGYGTEKFTGSKTKGEAAKYGSMLLFSLFAPGQAEKSINQTYQAAKQMISPNSTHSASKLMNGLNRLESEILKGRPRENASANQKFVLEQIDKFKNLIKKGKVSIEKLTAQKQSFHDDIAKHVYEIQDPKLRRSTKNLAKQITPIVNETLKDYGKSNPQWWRLQSDADKAYAARADSHFITRKLEDFVGKFSPALAHAFGIGLPSVIGKFISPQLGGSLGALYQTGKIAYQMFKSPLLRKTYGNVLKYALVGNDKALSEELKKLDSQYKKVKKEK